MSSEQLEYDKRWFTDGASMGYSPVLRNSFWAVNLILYALLNTFNLRILQGHFFMVQPAYHSGPLIPDLLSPLNIFQYPSYILIAAVIMGLLSTIPILVAQLYNLLTALPFILAVLFLGHNPMFALILLISAALVSFEPLRLKSKFVSALIGLIPILLYWILYSGENPEQDLLRWALLYAPGVLATVFSICFIGVVLLLGHFLRYRPGLLMPLFAATIAMTIITFHQNISMHERDFQAEVFNYSPSQIPEFRTRSISNQLNREMKQRLEITPYLPEDVILDQLRTEWYWAFTTRPEATEILTVEQNGALGMNNPVSLARRQAGYCNTAQIEAIDHIDAFLKKNRGKKREPDALYYKALLHDIKVDYHALRYEDTLQFYTHIPSLHSQWIWQDILTRYPNHPVSIEARYRLGWLHATHIPHDDNDTFQFRRANELLDQACVLALALIEQRRQEQQQAPVANKFYDLFEAPPPTIDNTELRNLYQRINHLQILISDENRTGHENHALRLVRFIALNPYYLNYDQQLKKLAFESHQPDPLEDNIQLAQILFNTKAESQLEQLNELALKFPYRDAGQRSRLLWAQKCVQQKNQIPVEQWQEINRIAYPALQAIADDSSYSFFRQQAQTLLDNFSPPSATDDTADDETPSDGLNETDTTESPATAS